MVFFIAFFFISFFSYFEFSTISKRSKNLLFILIIIGMYLIAAFRYRMGVDWDGYKGYFNLISFSNIHSLSDIKSKLYYYEPGYTAFNFLVKIISSNPQSIFIYSELILCICLSTHIYKYSTLPLISLMVYFGVFFLSLDMIFLRQALAVFIFLFSIKYVKERKMIKYFVCVLLAASMHQSALFLLPFYFILNLKISNRFIIAVAIIGFLLFFLKIDIFGNLLGFLNKGDVEKYANNKVYGAARGFSFIHVEIMILLTALLSLRKKIEILSPYSNIFINMFYMYTIIVLYVYTINAFSGRIKFYFIISYIYIIPYFFQLVPYKLRVLLYTFIVFYFYLYMANIIYFNSLGLKIYINYENYLFQ